VFAAVNDVAGQSSQAEWQFVSKVKKDTNQDNQPAEEDQRASKLAKRVHERSLPEPQASFGVQCVLASQRRRKSNELAAGEEVADFEGSGFWSVGAVRAVHLDAGAEVVADRAGRGFFRVGGAHGFAPLRNCAIGF